MRFTDDYIDQLLRSANPAPGELAQHLTAKEIRVRENIIRGKQKHARPRYLLSLTRMMLACVVLGVVAGVALWATLFSPSGSAVALTPPALHYTGTGSLSEVLADADRARDVGNPVTQSPVVTSLTWAWSAEIESEHIDVVPQVVSFEWGPGVPAVSRIVSGDSHWPDGERPENLDESPYRPGQLIDFSSTPADEFILPDAVAQLAGSSPVEIEAALASFGLGPNASSGEILAAISGLFRYWTLSDDQHSTLLQLLTNAGGLTVLGETTDRLGRDVVGIGVSSVIPERAETILISLKTGRIVGFESALLAPLDLLPRGIVSYTLWDVETSGF